MKKYGKLWNDINNLLSMLREDVEHIDNYYLQYGNTAPGELYRSFIEKLQERLDKE